MALTLTAFSPNGTAPNADGYDALAFKAEGSTVGKVQASTVAGDDPRSRSVLIGGVERPVLEAGLHIPIGAPVPAAGVQRGIGWEYVVTAVGPLDDPALVGMRFLVVAVPVKSKATARRLDVVDVTGLS